MIFCGFCTQEQFLNKKIRGGMTARYTALPERYPTALTSFSMTIRIICIILHIHSRDTFISSSLFARWQCCYSVFSTVIQTSIIGLTRHRRNGRELKFQSVRVTLNLPENGDEFTSATEIFPASLKFLYASVWT